MPHERHMLPSREMISRRLPAPMAIVPRGRVAFPGSQTGIPGSTNRCSTGSRLPSSLFVLIDHPKSRRSRIRLSTCETPGNAWRSSSFVKTSPSPTTVTSQRATRFIVPREVSSHEGRSDIRTTGSSEVVQGRAAREGRRAESPLPLDYLYHGHGGA